MNKTILFLFTTLCLAPKDRMAELNPNTFTASELVPIANCTLAHLVCDPSDSRILTSWRYSMAEYYVAMYNSYLQDTQIFTRQTADGLLCSSKVSISLEQARHTFILLNKYFLDLIGFSMKDRTVKILESEKYSRYLTYKKTLNQYKEISRNEAETTTPVDVKHLPSLYITLCRLYLVPDADTVVVDYGKHIPYMYKTYEEFLKIATTSKDFFYLGMQLQRIDKPILYNSDGSMRSASDLRELAQFIRKI